MRDDGRACGACGKCRALDDARAELARKAREAQRQIVDPSEHVCAQRNKRKHGSQSD
ncbi:MAG: hypothetical protein WC683_01755 [bacterium]